MLTLETKKCLNGVTDTNTMVDLNIQKLSLDIRHLISMAFVATSCWLVFKVCAVEFGYQVSS